MLLDTGHLPERARVSIGQEHRIVTETGRASRRPNQRAIGARLDFLAMAVRPGDTERRDEMRLAMRRLRCAALGEQAFDPRHRHIEILGRPRPPRREYARSAIESVDNQSGIIGEGWKLRRLCGRDRLDRCVGAKRIAGFLRLMEPTRAGRDCGSRLPACRRFDGVWS